MTRRDQMTRQRGPSRHQAKALQLAVVLCLGTSFQPVSAQLFPRSVQVRPDGVHARLAADLNQLAVELRDKLPGMLRESFPAAFSQIDLGVLRYVNQRASVINVSFSLRGPKELGVTGTLSLDADRERRKLSWRGARWDPDGAATVATATFSGRLTATAAGTELVLDALLDEGSIDPQLQELRGWLTIAGKLNGVRIGGRRISTADAGLTPGTAVQSFDLASIDARKMLLIDALLVAPPHPVPNGGKDPDDD